MVSTVLSNDRQSASEKLTIIGNEDVIAEPAYLNALSNTRKQLKGLKFGKYLSPPVQTMSIILEKFKPSLNYLSLCYPDNDHAVWENLLTSFLLDNSNINDLEVIRQFTWSEDNDMDFNHSFLEQAVNLTSYTYEGIMASAASIQSLFTFIASHKSLKSVSLTLTERNEDTSDSFIAFYEQLVAAVSDNLTIERVRLVIDVEVPNLGEFARLISEKTARLAGRNLTLNSVPVENIVTDLGNGLKDGLLWHTLDSESQVLSFE